MYQNNKRKLEDINSNFTKSFIFNTIKEANPQKSDIVTANLVNNHIKTNSHIFLKEPYKKKTTKKNCLKQPLSHKERRELGLDTLKQGEVTFKELVPIHKLWCQYVSEIGSKEEDIARADLHGCFMTVTKTMCPPLLRKCGIVAMESLNTFTVVDQSDKVHVLPKRGSVFSFLINDCVVNIFGNNFIFRPGERIMKKISKQKLVSI